MTCDCGKPLTVRTDHQHFRWDRSWIIALGKALLIISVLIPFLPGPAFAINYKKDYCGGAEYVGNAGGKYPHLHCTKDIFTLSRSKTDHINLHNRPNCNKVAEILSDPGRNYSSANNAAAITNALTAYQTAGCP